MASVGDVNAKCARASLMQGSSDMFKFASSKRKPWNLIWQMKAKRLREQAELLPRGAEREITLRKADQADTAAHIRDWLKSPGLKPPT